MDNAASLDQDRRILDAPSVNFETNLDSIRITFSAGSLAPAEYEGLPALSLALPTMLRRVQRRNTHRIDIPVSEPVHCRVHTPDGPVSLPVHDISAGGLSMRDEGQLTNCSVGHLFHECEFHLPGSGDVSTSLRVARLTDTNAQGLQRIRLVGCAFFNLPNPMSIRVQHYIVTLERRLIARARGFD